MGAVGADSEEEAGRAVGGWEAPGAYPRWHSHRAPTGGTRFVLQFRQAAVAKIEEIKERAAQSERRCRQDTEWLLPSPVMNPLAALSARLLEVQASLCMRGRSWSSIGTVGFRTTSGHYSLSDVAALGTGAGRHGKGDAEGRT